MKQVEQKTDVGVIVGRFMTHILTDGHKDLIQTVLDRHQRVIIFLGVAPVKNTLKQPLDFRSRKYMVEQEYPNVEVFPIHDNRSNELWSKNLDAAIATWLLPNQTVTLYGSRDSFLYCYSGKYHTCELEAELFVSATQIRKNIINNYIPSVDYRAGLIAATGMRYPVAYQTVDVAVINDNNEILLVKKPGEIKWRFIGGFSDPSSESLEQDARREVAEETGVEIDGITYLGSALINDWRYRSEQDKIKTALFKAKYIFGKPEGADDVEFTKWFPLDLVDSDVMVEEHHKLLNILKNKL